MYLHIIYYVFAHYIYTLFAHNLRHISSLSTPYLNIIYDRSAQSLSTTYLHIIYDVYLRYIIYDTFTQKDSNDHHQNPSSHRAPPKRVWLFRAVGWDIGFCFEVTEQSLPVTAAFRALMQATCSTYLLENLPLVCCWNRGIAIGFTQKCYGLFRTSGWDVGSVVKWRNKVLLWYPLLEHWCRQLAVRICWRTCRWFVVETGV